jgi:serine protease AprX
MVPVREHRSPAGRRVTIALLGLCLVVPVIASGGAAPAHWIIFTDKGPAEAHRIAPPPALLRLTDRARDRRERRGHSAHADWADLPLAESYLDRLRDRGLRIRTRSRWLNAVSVSGLEDPGTLSAEPWVKQIRPVARGRLEPITDHPPLRAPPRDRDDPHDYGLSAPFLHQIGVPALHERGLDGTGVLVGVIDTGFCLLHPALAPLDVTGCWDFIQDDSLVCNEPGESCYQHRHGTMVLSALAGRIDGELMGPAFGASFLLAKTEEVGNEDSVEEDRWVAAMEWMEAMGCDVVSSSLCFYTGYGFSDLDGVSSPAAQAADRAACLGVLVVNAAGNRRQNFGHIGVPADAMRLLAVGGVDLANEVTDFSGPGPTWDDRIKPDLAAGALAVPVADSEGGYCLAQGTSFSAPLVAGLAALLAEADPLASPCQLAWALKLSADRANAPDNDVGWGVPDGEFALEILAGGPPPAGSTSFMFHPATPNPFRDRTTLHFALDHKQHVRLDILDIRGRHLRRLVDRPISAGEHCFCWRGRDDAGRRVSGGVYMARLNAGSREISVKLLYLP